MKQVKDGTIGEEVYKCFRKRVGEVSPSEKLAWRNSLRNMYSVLNNELIPDDVGVFIEYRLPYQNRRIDFIVSGKNLDDSEHAVIVELKQWTEAKAVEDKHLVKAYVGHADRELNHPSYQAWSYAATLNEYNQVVQEDNIELHPCAFLHNYVVIDDDDPIVDANLFEEINDAPIFTRDDTKKLSDFVASFIRKNDDKHIIFRMDCGKLKPSKSLQDALNSMLKGNREFIMIDSQKVIYENIMSAVNRMRFDKDDKKVFVIKGGPGTGKSVLAINLLAEIIKDNKSAIYVTKNSAPRNVYFKKLCSDFKKAYVSNLFKGSGQFYEAARDDFDVVLVDEAHRLNAKSGMFKNKGENQIKEIINSARISVFFIDEDQRVTSYDIGTIDEIKRFAKEQNAKVIQLELESQFRCNGSDGYVSWLDNVLGIRETANDTFDSDDYDFKVFDDINEMRNAIVEKNKKNNKARLLAGYCWNWESKGDLSQQDIKIPEQEFSAQWNFGNTSTWAIDEHSVEQIGCIHTSQGLEFEYVGVIIGDDLRCHNGVVFTDYSKRAKTDQSLKGLVGKCRKNDREALKFADKIIRNTYKTLLSRGMKGCYVYCTNKELAEFIKAYQQRNEQFYREINDCV